MKVVVSQEDCISCGMCIGICPRVFAYNLDNKSVAFGDDIPEEDIPDALEACDVCPVNAIHVVEDAQTVETQLKEAQDDMEIVLDCADKMDDNDFVGNIDAPLDEDIGAPEDFEL